MLHLVGLLGKERFSCRRGTKFSRKFLAVVLVLTFFERGVCVDIVQPSDVALLVGKFYEDLQSYQANFHETKGTRIRKGLIKIQKPDKLLIQYLGENEQIQFSILSKGSKMYIEIPQFRVIVEQDMTFSDTESALLQGVGLVGTVDTFKEYDFNFESRGEIGYKIFATPKNNKILGLYPMQMQIGTDGCIEETTLESLEGVKISYRFFDVQKDLVYSEKDFELQNVDQFEILRNILVDLSSF